MIVVFPVTLNAAAALNLAWGLIGDESKGILRERLEERRTRTRIIRRTQEKLTTGLGANHRALTSLLDDPAFVAFVLDPDDPELQARVDNGAIANVFGPNNGLAIEKVIPALAASLVEVALEETDLSGRLVHAKLDAINAILIHLTRIGLDLHTRLDAAESPGVSKSIGNERLEFAPDIEHANAAVDLDSALNIVGGAPAAELAASELRFAALEGAQCLVAVTIDGELPPPRASTKVGGLSASEREAAAEKRRLSERAWPLGRSSTILEFLRLFVSPGPASFASQSPSAAGQILGNGLRYIRSQSNGQEGDFILDVFRPGTPHLEDGRSASFRINVFAGVALPRLRSIEMQLGRSHLCDLPDVEFYRVGYPALLAQVAMWRAAEVLAETSMLDPLSVFAWQLGAA